MRKIFLLFFPAIIIFSAGDAQGRRLTVGDSIPIFTLHDQDGKPFAIRDYIGKKILVIYFYPKDESPVCTKEACSFRDHYTAFTDAGAMVIGINAGSVESHADFEKHHRLPFVLLSDPNNKVLKLFGVKRKWMFSGRETFVVDLSGKIVFTYNAFTDGPAHAEKALDFITHHGK